MEKVSVIIPIYNVEKYLKKCIQSIIKQTYSNLEILLIDDGSNDSSSDICKEFEKIDKRINYIFKENGGVSSARNKGLEKATGDWITFIDPDDWAEDNMIEEAWNIAKNYNADIVQWNSYYNKRNEQTKRKAINPQILERKQQEIENFQLDILSTIYEEKERGISVGPIRGVWGKLYKSEVISNIKFNEKLFAFEDGLFNLNVFNNADKVVLFNKYLHHYRINDKSVCNSYKAEWLQQSEQILKEIQNFIKENNKEQTKFAELYNALACELLSSCLTRSIFHRDNLKSMAEKKRILKEHINTNLYREILNNINFKYLSNKQKLLVYLLKNNRINLVYIIYLIKQKIKK